MVGQTYVPNLASLEEGFPPALPVPELLREFAEWLATKPRSSLGWFHVESAPLEAKYVGDDDATFRIRERLGIFAVSPDGGRLALWKPDEGAAAVVRLGSGGVVDDVAPSLETFLISLSRGTTGVAALDREQSETQAVRAALAAWLRDRGLEPKPASNLAKPEGASRSFASWFDATREAARESHAVASQELPQLRAAVVPMDLFERVDPLLGVFSDDERVRILFESLGVHLDAIRDPDALRSIALPNDGVEFEIAWPWDRGSEWLAAEYPKQVRPGLELRRARMFWSMTLYVIPATRPAPRNAGERSFKPFAGKLPLGIRQNDDATNLEQTLGPPVRGSEGSRIWDFPARRRQIVGAFNEGPFARTDLQRGALKWLTWRFGQSV